MLELLSTTSSLENCESSVDPRQLFFRHVNHEKFYQHDILGGFFLIERGILVRKNPTEDPRVKFSCPPRNPRWKSFVHRLSWHAMIAKTMTTKTMHTFQSKKQLKVCKILISCNDFH